MVAPFAWLDSNWFALLQGFGIIGGLLFTATAFRRDTKARQISDLLVLTEHHRDLWSEVHRRPDLARVLQTEVDLVQAPISPAEQEFLNVVIVHFSVGWQLARADSLVTMAALTPDIRIFFAKPIPNRVWRETREERDPEFVSFVEDVLAEK